MYNRQSPEKPNSYQPISTPLNDQFLSSWSDVLNNGSDALSEVEGPKDRRVQRNPSSVKQ